jgi:nicotinamide phosphoribosyltransferase
MKIFAPHATDFYKTGHIFQYPPKTEFVYSNFTCRSDKWANVLPDFDHKVVLFNLQAVCQWLLVDLWNDTFFKRPKAEVVEKYKRRMDGSLGAGAVPVEHIAALHDLGYLPVLIKALPEGSRVNIRVPLFTIQNTLPEFYWITNYLETQISAEMWKAVTSATIAFEYRRLFERYAEETGVDPSFVDFQGHDFSMRGMSGIADATSNGAAHLLSFKGTDTITAIDYLHDYYFAGWEFVGGSVPATEHSVMCMGGELNELETFRRLITEVYPSGIVSIVSDSWDFWKVIGHYSFLLRDEIMKRDGKVVFRPDSGDPVKIIVGDPSHDFLAERKGAVETLWDIFGGTVTDKGYKTLDSHVGLIYGDSISLDIAQRSLEGLKQKGFSSANEVFGIGSFTYQHVTRDTFGSAIKATFGVVDGEDRELSKDPKTDSGVKKSAKGLIRDEFEGGDFVMYDQQTREQEKQGLLEPVFLDSKLVRHQPLHQIREILRNSR